MLIAKSLAGFMVFLIPSFVGAMIDAVRKDRRMNRRQFIFTVIVSTVAGCGLTPLFAHVFGIPEMVAPSLACFIAMYWQRASDTLWIYFKRKAGAGDIPESDSSHQDQ